VVRRARRIEKIMERTERAMEAGQLTAALGHELRNPLGILHTNAEVLKDRVEEEDRETVQDMIEEIGRLDGLIRRFLDLSSQKPGQWAPLEPAEIIGKAVTRNRKKLTEARVQCDIKTGEGAGPVSGQSDRLLRVFDNLIENALHALEVRQDGKIEILISGKRKSVIIDIRDNGPGFSTEALEHALQPFYTSRPKGSGIGLALCRRIIEDHGGQLTLKNLSQQGASVEIRLPKAG
jgi:signal transduction histidine kinase